MMSNAIAISPKLVIPMLRATSSEDAIRQLGGLLVSDGFAKATYVDAVLERERDYPTGIEFPLCGVAMPHGEPDGVLGAAIAIGRCAGPVSFKRMDDFEQDIEVGLIAMLAVNDPTGHLDVLGKLIGVFSDEPMCGRLLACRDSSEIARIINDAINGRG